MSELYWASRHKIFSKQIKTVINFANLERRGEYFYRSFFFLTLAHTPLSDFIPIVRYRPACTAEYNEGKRNFRRVNYERARKIAISRMLRRLLLRQTLSLPTVSRPVRFVFLFSRAYTNILAGSPAIMIDSTVIQPFSPRRSRLISARRGFVVRYYYSVCWFITTFLFTAWIKVGNSNLRTKQVFPTCSYNLRTVMFLQEIADETSTLFEESSSRFTFILFELDHSLQLSLSSQQSYSTRIQPEYPFINLYNNEWEKVLILLFLPITGSLF